MGLRTWIEHWPVYRQLTGDDPPRRGRPASSRTTQTLVPRTVTAEKVVKSICPYCAVGCGQNVYVQDGEITQIEGDPDSPVSRGRLCPKGAATKQLVTGSGREHRVLYRRPHAAHWEPLELDAAMDMIAPPPAASRRKGWQDEVEGKKVNRTLGFASLGGATL